MFEENNCMLEAPKGSQYNFSYTNKSFILVMVSKLIGIVTEKLMKLKGM